MAEDWQDAWQPMIDAIGKDFGANVKEEAIDEIEKGAIRKYLEPLQMDCPIYYDEDVAKAHGYDGIPAPISGLSQTWLESGNWHPGDRDAWPTHERDAMPERVSPEGAEPQPLPEAPVGFATDIEIEYHQDAYVGDRLHVTGQKLISCVPKETSVGKGAFMIQESYVRNQKGELIATLRRGLYSYVPN